MSSGGISEYFGDVFRGITSSLLVMLKLSIVWGSCPSTTGGRAQTQTLFPEVESRDDGRRGPERAAPCHRGV